MRSCPSPPPARAGHQLLKHARRWPTSKLLRLLLHGFVLRSRRPALRAACTLPHTLPAPRTLCVRAPCASPSAMVKLPAPPVGRALCVQVGAMALVAAACALATDTESRVGASYLAPADIYTVACSNTQTRHTPMHVSCLPRRLHCTARARGGVN